MSNIIEAIRNAPVPEWDATSRRYLCNIRRWFDDITVQIPGVSPARNYGTESRVLAPSCVKTKPGEYMDVVEVCLDRAYLTSMLVQVKEWSVPNFDDILLELIEGRKQAKLDRDDDMNVKIKTYMNAVFGQMHDGIVRYVAERMEFLWQTEPSIVHIDTDTVYFAQCTEECADAVFRFAFGDHFTWSTRKYLSAQIRGKRRNEFRTVGVV